MATQEEILAYYSTPGQMTGGGAYAEELQTLPDDIHELVRIVQGLAIHQYVAEPLYGVKISKGREEAESHLRRLPEMLDVIKEDRKPLTTQRPPGERLVGVCQHLAVLLVGILRAKGIPARCRYGFGAYFNPGFYEDHSLCEYWNTSEKRWVLVDPQFDAAWQEELHIMHNIFDVPRDAFVIAGDAWQMCRSGQAKSEAFGIFKGNMRGLWFIAGSIIRDIAALRKMEMLQWDTWGAMPNPEATLDDGALNRFDGLAVLTHNPDSHFDELRAAYEQDDISVPDKVFNGMRQRSEQI